MDDDYIEKPSCRVLYRQSSLETRLSPVHLSEESSSDDSNDDQEKINPKIVNYKIKPENTNQSVITCHSPFRKNSLQSEEKRQEQIRFQEKLQEKLNKPFPQNKLISKNDEESLAATQYKDIKIKSINTASGVSFAFKNELKHKVEDQERKKSREEKILLKPVVPRKPNRNEVSEQIVQAETNTSKFKLDDTLLIKSVKNAAALDDNRGGINTINVGRAPPDEVITSIGLMKAFNITKREVSDDETVGQSCQKKEEMATARPKSPRPVAIKAEKDESIWDKLGTLGRKKRIKEVQEVQAEGKYAIDSPGCPTAPVIPPEEYNLDDNEERCMIDPRAYDDPKFNELLNVLKEWINDELASQRIIVQDLSEDLYDGQVLQKLLEKLTGDKLDVPEVTQSEEGQKQKLSVVLGHFNQVLGIQRISHNKWSVEAIHSKNIVAITHLLVALARHFRPPVRLPEHVTVDVVIVQKVKGVLNHKTVRESLTKVYDDVGMRCERDAFDTLFDHAPEKLQVVKKSLVTFVNKHLNKMNFEVTEIESQFHDGVYLIMLMGLLEGFFVPHYSFHLTPHEFDQKVHNVNFAFELMEEVGLQKPKARPEDVVNMDLKSTLRVLYNLFLKYKTML